MPYCVDCNKEFGATGLFDLDFRSYCPDCARARKRKEADEERERRHQEDEERRHRERLAADDDRFQREQELEEERHRDEEMRRYDEEAQAEERERDREYEREARAARAVEERVEALERARLAKIAHEVEAACRASRRKLAAGRANEALADAERALDQDPNDETALSCAYFAARSANSNAAALAFLGRWVARHIARTQSRYQPDSSTSDLLIAEAASSTLGADQLIRSLVDAYRSGPTNLLDTLAKVGRSELFGPWLEIRLKRFFVEKLGIPVESLLEALAALPDGPTRISALAEHLVEYVSFRAPFAEWLKASGYVKDAASYVRSCATGPNAISGFDSVFSEWLIANGYLGDANNYLRDRAPKCNAATRVSTLIPLGIETSRRMKSSTSDWSSMLRADLATLPFAKISASTLTSSVLSSESKDDVIKAMIGHVEHVISGPESYRAGAGLPKATAGRGAVYSIKSGKELSRPLLDLNAPLVGGVCGLAAWLLPGGTFSVGIVWGALTAAIAWIWTFIYSYRKHEISASIVGRYCSDYSKVLERLGARAQLTAALVSKAPNANPTASLLAALGTIGFLTALVCAGNYFGDNRPGTDLASRGLAGSSAEWIQDWGVATNRTRMTARLGRDSSGPTLTVHDRFCGSCSDGNPLASPDKSPRYTVQIGKCSSKAGQVRCDAISTYHADPSLGAIRTTFELDFLKRSGKLTFFSRDGSTLVNTLYYTPSSMSRAPAWLRDQSRAIGPPDRSVAQAPTPQEPAAVPAVAPGAPSVAAAPPAALPPSISVASIASLPAQSGTAPTPHDRLEPISTLLRLAKAGNWSAVDEQVALVRSNASRPVPSDRVAARSANREGLAALARQDYTVAVVALRRAVEVDPGDVEAQNNLGFALLKERQNKESIDVLERLLLQAPARSSAWANLAEAASSDSAVGASALRLAVRFSANRDRTVSFLKQVLDNHPDEQFRAIAGEVLASVDAIPGGSGDRSSPDRAPTRATQTTSVRPSQ